MIRDYTDAALAALENRERLTVLREAFAEALEALERADPDHGEFWCAAHDVATAYRAAREAGAI